MRSTALAAILAVSFLAAGCGEVDDGGYDLLDVCDVETGLFIDFFEQAIACQPEFELILGSVPTAAELSTACDAQFGPFVDDGTIVISQDSSAWTQCLDFITNLDCDTFSFDGPNPCDVVFEGQLLDGEACDTNEQCADDAYCDDSDGLACGTCTLRLTNDEICSIDDECSSRLCADDDTCQDFGIVDDACVSSFECAGTLICDVDGFCDVEPIWLEDDACTSIETECGFPFSDLYCSPITMSCQLYLELGEVCGQAAGLCRILNYETCENGGVNPGDVCIAATIVNEGEDCGFQDGLKCADGLICYDDNVNETCIQPYVDGEACINDDCPGGILLDCQDDGFCGYSDYTGECPAPPV